MDNPEHLLEFLSARHYGRFKYLTRSNSEYPAPYEFKRNDNGGINDFLKVRHIDWHNAYLCFSAKGVSVLPYFNQGREQAVLAMPQNMLFTAGIDIKLRGVQEQPERKEIIASAPLMTSFQQGNYKVEHLEHMNVSMPGVQGDQIQGYMRILDAESLEPFTADRLIELREEGALTQGQINDMILDLSDTVVYLWSQGIQGISQAIYLKNDQEFTFIASHFTKYSHYGCNNEADLQVLSQFLKPELKLEGSVSQRLLGPYFRDMLDPSADRLPVVWNQEFNLPDVKLPAQQTHRLHEFYECGMTSDTHINLELVEMLQTLLSLGLYTQLRYNLSELVTMRTVDARKVIKEEIMRVYLNNLNLTKYVRAPVYVFSLGGNVNMYAEGAPSDIYQAKREELKANTVMTHMIYPARFTFDKYDFDVNQLVKPIQDDFPSRLPGYISYSKLTELENKIWEEEDKRFGRPPVDDPKFRLARQSYNKRRIAEIPFHRTLSLIHKALATPQVPLNYQLSDYPSGSDLLPSQAEHQIAHKVSINGIEFNTTDILHIFYDTPLTLVVNHNDIILSGFSLNDLRLIRDFLKGRKTIVSLYRGLSLGAYNQLSSYGTLLSTYEVTGGLRSWTKIFSLGIPFVDQVRANKKKLKEDFRGDEYLHQRLELI